VGRLQFAARGYFFLADLSDFFSVGELSFAADSLDPESVVEESFLSESPLSEEDLSSFPFSALSLPPDFAA